MIQPPVPNHKSTIRVNETPGKSVHNHSHPRSMKYYSLMLAIVAVIAAIVLGVILLLEQKRFFKMETSATLSYNPVTFSEKVYTPSASEVLRIIQADIVKKEAYDMTGIPEDEHKENYVKNAFDVNYDLPQNSGNLLKVSVKWDDKDEASQLTGNYVKAAIQTYHRIRTDYLLEMQRRLLKVKQEKEARIGAIEKHLSQLHQSIQNENVKAELETLKKHRDRLEKELADLKKQLQMNLVQQEGMKTITPNKSKRQKLKNALQHAYVMKLIQKRDDTLEDFEVQKATGKETDQQFKQAQVRYGYVDECLKRRLDELNLSEQDVLDLDSGSLNRMEELDSSEATMLELKKLINEAQEQLTQIQKQISDACKLLSQEEKLYDEHGKTLSQIHEIDQDIQKIGSHIMMTVVELQSLGFINIHHVNMFTSKNYIFAILIGIIITTSLLSLLILATELGSKHHAKVTSQTTTSQTTAKP